MIQNAIEMHQVGPGFQVPSWTDHVYFPTIGGSGGPQWPVENQSSSMRCVGLGESFAKHLRGESD